MRTVSVKDCPMCHGSGKGQPVVSGMESAWKINQYLMKQDCKYCNGTGKIAVDDNPSQLEIDLYTKVKYYGR